MLNKILLLLIMTWNLMACAPGNGDGLDSNGQPANSNNVDLSVLKPELNSIQYNIFTPYCSGCHSGPGAPQGLKLDNVENSYSLMVNQASSQDSNLQRVVPNSPDNSYLIHKIEGLAYIGDRMPIGQASLPSELVGIIKLWIMNGAEEPEEITQDIPAPFESTLEAIQTNLFDVLCISCHGDNNPERGLNLGNIENSYNNLVNQDSDEIASVKLVAPSDADNSYLIQKLEGTAFIGSSMPLGLARVPPGQIDVVRQWINDGAQKLLPTLSSIQANIFNRYCISCHAGDSPSGNLNLTNGNSFNQLVSQVSLGNNSIELVAISDADNSYLIQKLEGNAGTLMPMGSDPLNQDTINIIRLWIDSGATNN